MDVRAGRRIAIAENFKLTHYPAHVASLAIYYMHYNFVRIHQSLRVTPAMAAGVTDRLWSVADLMGLLT